MEKKKKKIKTVGSTKYAMNQTFLTFIFGKCFVLTIQSTNCIYSIPTISKLNKSITRWSPSNPNTDKF